jgi:hypothetical protein
VSDEVERQRAAKATLRDAYERIERAFERHGFGDLIEVSTFGDPTMDIVVETDTGETVKYECGVHLDNLSVDIWGEHANTFVQIPLADIDPTHTRKSQFSDFDSTKPKLVVKRRGERKPALDISFTMARHEYDD